MTPAAGTGARVARITVLGALVGLLAAVFGPGSMTPDTIDMCQQAVRDVFNDWHSPIATGAWGLVDVGIRWIFLGQLVLTVAAVHLILSSWLRPWISVAACWVVMWFPATLGWMGHVGKDEWFAAATLMAVALLSRAGRAPSGRARWWLLGAGLAACWAAVAARPNGIVPIAAVLVVVLPVTLWQDRPRVVALGARLLVAAAVASAVLVTTTAWERLVVTPSAAYPMQVGYLYDLAGMSVRSQQLLLPEVALERPVTVEQLEEVFTPGATNEFYFGEDSPIRFGPGVYDSEQMSQLAAAWRSAILEHPDDWLATRWQYATLVTGWSAPQPASSVNDPGVVSLARGTICPIPPRWNPGWHEATLDVLDDVATTNIWRGWWFAVLLAGAAAVAGLRRVAEARALAAAGLVSLASVMVAGGTTTFRYSWFTALCAVVATMLALWRVPPLARPGAGGVGTEAPEQADDEPDEAAGETGGREDPEVADTQDAAPGHHPA